MERLIELLCAAPRKRFQISLGEDYSVWDLNASYRIDPDSFLSMGKATPFEGTEVFGKCLITVCDGLIVYNSLT